MFGCFYSFQSRCFAGHFRDAVIYFYYLRFFYNKSKNIIFCYFGHINVVWTMRLYFHQTELREGEKATAPKISSAPLNNHPRQCAHPNVNPAAHLSAFLLFTLIYLALKSFLIPFGQRHMLKINF